MRSGCLISTALGLLALVQVPAVQGPAKMAAPVRSGYVGDAACEACHQAKVESFHRTAHFLTSREPDKNSILGHFTSGANVLRTSNSELLFRMDEKANGFFETAVEGMDPAIAERSERIDLVVGSGGKGQTYAFWKGDRLFQLPVSYWNEVGWVNSPGYRDGVANFDRPIVPRCLECHASYFEAEPPPPNRYKKDGYVVGITCEKCHGPGRKHVARESAKTGPADAAILNPVKFSRERQVDLCAWCHAGHGIPLGENFSYVPGQALSESFEFPPLDPNAELDVHGNQVELLKKSQCFLRSGMTCLTCHDVHTVQRDGAAFSQRCLGCHQPGTAMYPKRDHQAKSDCIDCHMPKLDTNLIVFSWNGKKVRPQVRSHWIKVYSGSGKVP